MASFENIIFPHMTWKLDNTQFWSLSLLDFLLPFLGIGLLNENNADDYSLADTFAFTQLPYWWDNFQSF